MPTSSTTRRSALRGISLTAIAAGLAVPALAAPAVPPDTDAELIRLCGEVVAIQDKINALYQIRHSVVEDERRTEDTLGVLYDAQSELLDLAKAAAVPPATLAGATAMAKASIAIAPLDVDGNASCGGGDSEWFSLVVVNYLAASAVS